MASLAPLRLPAAVTAASMPPPPRLSGVALTPAVAASPAPGQVRLLVDLEQFEPRLSDAIRGAKQSISLEMFNFAADGSGQRIGDLLVQKAREGVDVNIIMDRTSLLGFPSWKVPLQIRRLTDAGAHVVMTNPFSDDAGRKNVTHRKIVSIDGTTAFAGGVNLGKLTDSYHDAMYELTGAAAARVSADALQRWHEVGGTPSARFTNAVAQAVAATNALSPGASPIDILRNSPSEPTQREATAFYRDAIRGAKERVWIASPAFTNPDVMDDLIAAAKRGVDVRVVASGKPPLHLPPISWSTRAAMRDLIAAGGKVWETPGVAHTKALVADNAAGIGSYNITKRSEQHDHEVVLASREAEVVDQVVKLFQNDMSTATPLTLEKATSGLGQRLTNALLDRVRFSY